jgi:hypothetical protein
MQTFRLLYFRESILENAEEVRARDLLEAVEKAAGQPPDVRVEVWSDHRRVGIIGPSRAQMRRGEQCPRGGRLAGEV